MNDHNAPGGGGHLGKSKGIFMGSVKYIQVAPTVHGYSKNCPKRDGFILTAEQECTKSSGGDSGSRASGRRGAGGRSRARSEALASPSASIVRGRGPRSGASRAGHCGEGGRCSRGCHLSNSWRCGLVVGGGLRGGRRPRRAA